MYAAELQLRSGVYERLASDEESERDWPLSFDHETQIPGGHGSATITIAQHADLESDDRYSNARIEVYDVDGDDTIYKGIVLRASQDGESNLRLECVGPSILLELNRAYRWGFIHQAMSEWRGQSPARQNYLTVNNNDGGDGQVSPSPSDGAPALKLSLTGEWSRTNFSESWFDHVVAIGEVYVSVDKNGAIVLPNANWSCVVGVSNDDVTIAGETNHELLASMPVNYSLEGNGDERHARVRLRYAVAGGAEGVDYAVFFTALGVYSTHDLPRVGDPTTTLAPPLAARDIILAALSEAAPDVEVDPFMVTDSGLPVYHCSSAEPSTVRALVEELAKRGTSTFEIPDWGYYDSFFWMRPGTYGRTWVVSREEAAEILADGPDTENRVGGVIVTYRDAAGTTYTVGPPDSGADTETALLEDTDPANPATAFEKNWATFDAGTTALEGAIDFGIVKMYDLNRLRWKGSITFKGKVRSLAGNWFDVGKIRGGDQVVVEDDVDREPLPIVQTSHNGNDSSCKADIDRPDTGYADVLATQVADANSRAGVA